MHEVRTVERAISHLDSQLEATMLASGTSVLKLHGVGIAVAAILLGLLATFVTGRLPLKLTVPARIRRITPQYFLQPLGLADTQQNSDHVLCAEAKWRAFGEVESPWASRADPVTGQSR